ncbi:hypothetical protein KY385_04035 [Candidatus Parcubacteria bacterium]|nr:hypothetical protein [Candidatus Parcubacteria bacterium]
MKKLNDRGFGVIEGLLILVIVGIIGGAGFYVYKQNQEPKQSSAPQASSEQENKNKTNYTYTLPNDWSEISCGGENEETNPPYKLVFPNNDRASNCSDRTNVVHVVALPYDYQLARCQTQEEANADKLGDSIKQQTYSYKCKETSIKEIKTLIVETYYESQPGFAEYLGCKYCHSLDFSLFKNEKLLNITYKSDSKGLPYAKEAHYLAESVKFY